MAFSKSFPKQTDKSPYPKWEEVFLTDKEELQIEKEAREENIELLGECMDDAIIIMTEKHMRPFDTSLVSIAIALFEKRASHTAFKKEQKAKDKFDANRRI
jgi:hypothetical protein